MNHMRGKGTRGRGLRGSGIPSRLFPSRDAFPPEAVILSHPVAVPLSFAVVTLPKEVTLEHLPAKLPSVAKLLTLAASAVTILVTWRMKSTLKLKFLLVLPKRPRTSCDTSCVCNETSR